MDASSTSDKIDPIFVLFSDLGRAVKYLSDRSSSVDVRTSSVSSGSKYPALSDDD